MPYALVHGAPRIAAFTDKALQDERVKALSETVTAAVDPGARPRHRRQPGADQDHHVRRQVFEQRKDFSTGSDKLPMSQAQIEDKFFDCAAQVMSPDAAKNILAVLNTLSERTSMNDLWPLLRKA